MNPIFYSIIVPSYNRKSEIKDMLESFTRLDFPKDRYEIIIADDGSTDGTDRLVENYRKAGTIPLTYISQKNKGPGAARNFGMAHAKGEYFIFIDSDCTVSEKWLEAIDRHLQTSGADAFGGPDNCRDDFPPLLKAINYSMTSFITTGGIRGHKKKKLGKYYPRSFNMGLKRSLYKQIGGFGGLRHGQDIEFSNRILRSGAKVVQIDDAVVYHKRRTSIKKFMKQVYNWGVARINLFKMDGKMLEFVHFLPAIALWLVILIILFALLSSVGKYILILSATIGIFVILFSMIDCYIKYTSIKTALWIPIVIPIQILGYGTGFTIGFIRRIILGQGEFTGFTKRYYQ
ncbi:MAG: glycosyltransferase [candidate division KSB1 bacterium]|jgi:glycosyltransferase involved in cell wall biosynthesis|nr:glycosyltransferase [candidate division KSB1 bacterium]